MTTKHALDGLPPLYHSYALFGEQNQQLGAHYPANQQSKQPIILAYIQYAIAKCRDRIADEVSFAELFCADGFYTMAALHLGATRGIGIDNDRDGHSRRMLDIAARLGLTVEFNKMDVHDIAALPPVDIVGNLGGLYHVPDPEAVLDASYAFARRFLIVQTVVTLASTDPDYFVTPAPGWTWGSRYSRQSFERLLARKGWRIVDQHFNHLEGNGRLQDKGSCYALIAK